MFFRNRYAVEIKSCTEYGVIFNVEHRPNKDYRLCHSREYIELYKKDNNHMCIHYVTFVDMRFTSKIQSHIFTRT